MISGEYSAAGKIRDKNVNSEKTPADCLTERKENGILALEKRECQQSCGVSANMGISDRKKKILAAVVDEYIRTAEPVGSKHLAENAGLGCSSATIRNELAELVALGYLDQPHTSAGRVPTPMGYRMYVNELMEKQKLSLEETEDLNRRLNLKLQELDDTIGSISRLASQLTEYPALALTAASPTTVKRVDLIYVDANTFIIVLMLSGNSVKSKLVRLRLRKNRLRRC